MNPFKPMAAIVVVMLCGLGEAKAGTIFSNLGPGGSFGSGSWTIQMVEPIAFAFTASETATLGSLELAVGTFTSNVTGTAFLTTDIGGAPGLTLASWSFAVPQTLQGSLVTLDYPTDFPPVTLSQGTEYWVYLGDNTNPDYAWFTNSTGYSGPGAGNLDGSWRPITNGTPAAFQVNGSVVPEPSSLALSVVGFVMVAVVLRRRYGRIAAT
jgi:hypothetical protein